MRLAAFLALVAFAHAAEHSHYAVIDAGSSGSRIFLYKVVAGAGAGKAPRLEPVLDGTGEVLQKKQKPGLSSFADRPMEAYHSIRPLLDFIAAVLPAGSPAVPLSVYGTAGLRMVPAEKRARIMEIIVTGVAEGSTQFTLGKGDIRVISGEREGMFAWLTINYAKNLLKGEGGKWERGGGGREGRRVMGLMGERERGACV